MKTRARILLPALLWSAIVAFQPGCADDSNGSGDDTASAGADDTGGDSTANDNIIVDSTADSNTVDSNAEGNLNCTCVAQASCPTTIVNNIDYTYSCTSMGYVCCKQLSATTDTSGTNDTSQIGDTSAGTDSGSSVDTGWWNRDTESSGAVDTDSSSASNDSEVASDSDSQQPVDTATNTDCQFECVGVWQCDDANVVEGQTCGGRLEVCCDNGVADTGGDTEVVPDTAENTACQYECVRNWRCDDADVVENQTCESGNDVCCDDGSADTGQDTGGEPDTTEDTPCSFECVRSWQCDDADVVEGETCDGRNEVCCNDGSTQDTETADTDAPAPNECAAAGFYCVAATQCTVAQAELDYDCDINGTVCCDISK